MSSKKRNEVINSLLKEHPIDQYVQFNEINIKDKLQNIDFMITKYQELYLKEKNIYDKIMSFKEKIVGEQYDYYKFNYDKVLTPSEIKNYYLPKDKKIIKINNLLNKQMWRVDFFQMCYQNLKNVSWNMKTYTNLIKSGL